MCREGGLRGTIRILRRNTSRGIKVRLTSIIASLERVSAFDGNDLDCRQSDRAHAAIEYADRDLNTRDALLDECDIAIVVRVDHRARKVGAIGDDRDALSRSALSWLHD